MVVIFT